jgi:protein SCO1/2
MSPPRETPPALRLFLWGLLVSVLLAIVVTTIFSRSWLSGAIEPPPILGEVPDFTLVNRDGREVSLGDLAGAPWVADFIFTRCPATCPVMSSQMAKLQKHRAFTSSRARLVTFSVDPAHDTSEVLEAYARRFEAGERWWFLTGSPEVVFPLVREGFRLGVDPTPPEGQRGEPIVHSTRFVLVDGQGRIRGYYDGLEDDAVERLAEDVRALDLIARRSS